MNQVRLPENHQDRYRLNDELHARPPVALWPNEQVLYLALVNTGDKRLQEEVLIRDLFASLGGESNPLLQGNNIEFDVPVKPGSDSNEAASLRLRVKYERHSEFSSWWFFQQTNSNDPNLQADFCCNLDQWISKIPGEVLVAMNIRVCQVDDLPAMSEITPYFSGNTVIGSLIAHELGAAFTDFRIGANDRTGLLFLNRSMVSRQAGRMLQGLVEIETYRMMALRSLPIVQEAFPTLSEEEEALIKVSRELASEVEDDRSRQLRDIELQQKISRISSSIEALSSSMQYRLEASDAYFQLVQRRINDLNESKIPGVQGFGEFMERRLLPAMKTCSTFSQRIRETSHRVSRISQLLQTRVDITREAQNSKLLASMDQRSKLQLQLQEAVEGLSIVAISYYSIGITTYVFKAIKTLGLLEDPELATGIATPLILILVVVLIRRIRNSFK